MPTKPLTLPEPTGCRLPFSYWFYMAALALLTNAGCSKPKSASPQPETLGNVVALVSDEQITAEQFSAESAARHIGDNPEAKKAQLTEMIHARLLGQEARRRGLDHDPQMIAAFDNLLAERMQQEIRIQVKASPQEIDAYYKAHTAEFMTPTAVRSAVIFVAVPAQTSAEGRAAKRATMDSIRQQAMGLPPNTTGFGPLAAQYSDDQDTKLKGGDMGFFVQGHVAPKWEKPVIDAALALASPNQLSDVVSTDCGYYLVKLTAKHNASARPLESVRAQIEKRFAEDQERKFVAGLVKAAEDKKAIKVFEERLATAPVRSISNSSPNSRQSTISPNR